MTFHFLNGSRDTDGDLAFYVMAGYLKCEGQFVSYKIHFGSTKVVYRRHQYKVYF